MADDPTEADDVAWQEILESLEGKDAEKAKSIFLTRCSESAIEARAESRALLNECAEGLTVTLGHCESYASCVSCGESQEDNGSKNWTGHFDSCDVLGAKKTLEKVGAQLGIKFKSPYGRG